MITQKQTESLKGKCPIVWNMDEIRIAQHPESCECQGTGQASIEIEKEWRECDCYCHTKHSPERKGKHFGMVSGDFDCPDCNGNGKIPKYKVGQEIGICPKCGLENYKDNKCGVKPIILKIISEMETHWKVISA